MENETKKVLARISKLCKNNIEAFGKDYDPRWKSHSFNGGEKMKGAKAEGAGVVDMAKEILSEIKSIRSEFKKHAKNIDKILIGKKINRKEACRSAAQILKNAEEERNNDWDKNHESTY